MPGPTPVQISVGDAGFIAGNIHGMVSAGWQTIHGASQDSMLQQLFDPRHDRFEETGFENVLLPFALPPWPLYTRGNF